jgi:glycosyltransferase involved in cell wall biosynthesis
MPRKCSEEAAQIISILNERGVLGDWILVPIHDMHESEVAAILRESAIFLSFSQREGFGLPPLEAISCGCIVIGYHGGGGEEYFQGPTIFPITQGEIVEFAQTIEKIALNYDSSQETHSELTLSAKNMIENEYSSDREKKDLARAWKVLLKKHEVLLGLNCSLHPLNS